MDIQMPRLDGIQATRRIMEHSPAPVIMLTAYSDPEIVQGAIAAGASAYLVKPVVDEQLHPTLSVARTRFGQLQQERSVATSLAQSFVARIPAIAGFQVAARYEPAFAVGRVGGDFFDFIPLTGNRIGVVVGDVCGKGITTANYTTMARHMLRAYSLEDPDPVRVLERLNHALFPLMSEEHPFLTVVYGVVDTEASAFTYAAAGHPGPVLYDPIHRACRPLEATGGVVGALEDLQCGKRQAALPAGAVLALVTDGVTEARQGGEMFEGAGVCSVVQACATRPPNEIADAVLAEARAFAGGRLIDDVVIVVLRHE
jgi:sigma-B regulation protein RsbU (phosphoserine phosphatase)